MNESKRRQSIIQRLVREGDAAPPARLIPSGFPTLDAALGGGFPRTRMVEIFGPAGCGKTTLALQSIASLQRAGLNAAFIDADHAFDAAYASSLGVAIDRLPLVQPNSAEQALEIARTLAASGAVDLVAVDSAAALAPRLEVEAGIAGVVPRLQSRVLADELRKLSGALRRGDACALFVNQMRTRADRGAGEAETSAGGPPLKLFAAVRIALLPAGASKLRLRVLKNNAAAGAREGELQWLRGSGFVA